MQIPDTAPFTDEQKASLNRILPTLTPSQVQWLTGFVAGVEEALRLNPGAAQSLAALSRMPLPLTGDPTLSEPVSTAAATTQSALSPIELTVLYGSESGNAESLAQETRKAALKRGMKASVLDMGDCSPASLATRSHLLVITSTWGDGDPPDNAIELHTAVMGSGAPSLNGVKYSVCALGDTSYDKFCETGKDFDRRFEELGATRIFDRMDCDVDYEAPFQRWLTAVLDALGTAPSALTTPAVLPFPASNGSSALLSDAVTEAVPVRYSKSNPFPAPLREKILLSGRGSAKEVWHYEFSLDNSAMTYEPGDSLALIPRNAPEDVDPILAAGQFKGALPVDGGSQVSAGAAFLSMFDITTLTKAVLTKYNVFAQSKKLAAIIEDSAALKDYLYGRQIVDLLHDYPVKGLGAADFISCIRKMPPRLYSIASSLRAHPGEVHLTVASVRYESHGRTRRGVASTFLADRVEIGAEVPVYTTPNKHFKLPQNPTTPIIMVGPGTGIAPFRAFLEEREALGATGKNWLFFGDQHYTTDFLYQVEWQSYLKDGLLTRLDVAFSRDQKHKVYVQDRMRENAAQLWEWIDNGAIFYVCGDAARMAGDVHATLIAIVSEHSGRTREDAEDYVKQLQKQRRYLRDVY